jgi:hypothetical protein
MGRADRRRWIGSARDHDAAVAADPSIDQMAHPSRTARSVVVRVVVAIAAGVVVVAVGIVVVIIIGFVGVVIAIVVGYWQNQSTLARKFYCKPWNGTADDLVQPRRSSSSWVQRMSKRCSRHSLAGQNRKTPDIHLETLCEGRLLIDNLREDKATL